MKTVAFDMMTRKDTLKLFLPLALFLLLLTSCGDLIPSEGNDDDDDESTATETSTGSTEDTTDSSSDDPAESLTSGEQLFTEKCAQCHGTQGTGGSAPSLVNCHHCTNTTTLQQKIQDTMPPRNPGDCADSCASDIAAYILATFK